MIQSVAELTMVKQFFRQYLVPYKQLMSDIGLLVDIGYNNIFYEGKILYVDSRSPVPREMSIDYAIKFVRDISVVVPETAYKVMPMSKLGVEGFDHVLGIDLSRCKVLHRRCIRIMTIERRGSGKFSLSDIPSTVRFDTPIDLKYKPLNDFLPLVLTKGSLAYDASGIDNGLREWNDLESYLRGVEGVPFSLLTRLMSRWTTKIRTGKSLELGYKIGKVDKPFIEDVEKYILSHDDFFRFVGV